MSDSADDICGLPEVIETEQVVEILEESQFLDLAASMETRGEIMVANTSCFSSSHEEKESRQLIGHKRKRGGMDSEVLEEAGVFGLPLPTAVVPPSPRQVIATPLPSQPSLITPSHHQDSQSATSPHHQDPTHTSPLPAVNIQLTSDELQALIGILRQRDSTPHSHPPTITSTPSMGPQSHQLIAPKKLVTAVVMSSSTSSTSSLSLPSSRAIMEAQTVAAAKASVQGKRRHCSCKNSQCLKLYCDCFSHEESCSVDCSCRNCRNNPAYSEMRELTLKMYKGRDPTAFHHSEDGEAVGQRNKGCKCRKTLCLKKYCECFHSGILCTSLCRCINCKNTAVPTPNPQSHPNPVPLSLPTQQVSHSTEPLPSQTVCCVDDSVHVTHIVDSTSHSATSTGTMAVSSTHQVGCASQLGHELLITSSLTRDAQLLSHVE